MDQYQDLVKEIVKSAITEDRFGECFYFFKNIALHHLMALITTIELAHHVSLTSSGISNATTFQRLTLPRLTSKSKATFSLSKIQGPFR